ncbi:MAG: flagellar hook-associated protein FlgK [Firmicutes bacterium]|nr:flagellar hook-associated protein FlgK [Bacillota bacterium]
MDGLFGIEIARKALSAAQYGMDVTSHNIANANTPGYTRQRALLGTTTPFPAPYWNRPLIQGQLGTGVEVKTIERMRDGYFDSQMRLEGQSLGSWQIKDNAMKQIETIFNEPSEAGLLNIMGEFWNAWQQLSKNPESLSIRANVVEMGRTLATSFNQLDDKLSRLQDNLNEQIKTKVDDINNIAQRIMALNQDILRVKAYGNQPNDLLDQRDNLIDELSRLADVQIVGMDNGAIQIFLDGRLLVGEHEVDLLQVTSNPSNNGYYDVVWAVDGAQVGLNGGEVKSLLDTRDITVNKYKGKLDTLASNLATEVNALHNAGFGLDGTTGWNFFDTTNLPITAKNITISTDVTDLNHIAAASAWPLPNGAPGDNSNALAIGQLKDKLIGALGSITLDDYYRSIVTDYGIESQEAGRMVTNGKLYFELIETHRQSVSGVSLDEEASNMIKFQRAYQAAAKVVVAFDEMLDVLINGLVKW